MAETYNAEYPTAQCKYCGSNAVFWFSVPVFAGDKFVKHSRRLFNDDGSRHYCNVKDTADFEQIMQGPL